MGTGRAALGLRTRAPMQIRIDCATVAVAGSGLEILGPHLHDAIGFLAGGHPEISTLQAERFL
jgi:hypothetical protein